MPPTRTRVGGKVSKMWRGDPNPNPLPPCGHPPPSRASRDGGGTGWSSRRGFHLSPHSCPRVALFGSQVWCEVGLLKDGWVINRECLLQRLICDSAHHILIRMSIIEQVHHIVAGRFTEFRIQELESKVEILCSFANAI